MITAQTIVVNQSIPDLTLAQFTAILEAGSSPALVEAPSCYQAIRSTGVSVAFALAIFRQESNFGTQGFATVNKNPGNTRSSTTGIGMVVNTVKGPFIRYPTWYEGFRDMTWRIVRPNGVYAQEGRKTIEQIITRWAPPSENDTATYISNVVSSMNEWIGEGSNSNTMEIIDLSNNTPSSVYSDRMGFSVDELILHDTAGSSDNNNASQAACQNALDATIRWFQGPGGVSIHYLIGPENLGGKIYRLCKESVAAYHAIGNKGSVGGVSKDNLISIGIERFGQPNEAVGPNQRNAMLWLVADICQRNGLSADQVVSHMSIQSDRRDGGVLLAAARQFVTSGGLNHVTTENQKPVIPDNGVTQINGKTLGGGFKTFYDKLAGVSPNFQLLVLGLPVTNEFDCDVNGDGKAFTVQLFERSGLIYEAANSSPWDIHSMTTSQLENALAFAAARALLN